ncbi:hypothetical protein Bhyg_12183, partial [Pseudolycoriella hygida]
MGHMKKCAVLGCPNTEASVPSKFLFCAPRDYATRGLWIQTTGKDYSHSSMFFVCEDHFDLTKDVDYYNVNGKPKLQKFTSPTLKLEGNIPAKTQVGLCATDFTREKSCSSPPSNVQSGPSKRKADDLTQSTDTSSGEPIDNVLKDMDYEPCQSDSSEEVEESDISEDEDSNLLASFDDSDSDYEEDDSNENNLMCRLTIMVMERNIQHYTGIPEASQYVIDSIIKTGISKRNVLLVLRKIRRHFKFWVMLSFKLFKHKYRNVQAIIDCFEISISKPSNPVDQALSYSSYKHSNTIKFLIAATPDGLISFISKGFTGRVTDNEIVKRSGFLEFIKENMEVLADRGFKDIAPDIMSKGGVLLKPPSTTAGIVFTAEEAKHCKTVAAIRIHIERVIRKLRYFAFLKPQNSL